MSDFGTLVIAKKKDGKRFSSSERSDLSNEMKQIINQGSFEDAGGEKFKHEFEESYGDDSFIMVRLSDHYFGGNRDEDQASFEFVEDLEIPDAEEIIEKLQKKFPDYDFECSVEKW